MHASVLPFYVLVCNKYDFEDKIMYFFQTSNQGIQDRENNMTKLDHILKATAEELSVLSDKTGMPITQENGQRRYGPPIGSTHPPKKGKYTCCMQLFLFSHISKWIDRLRCIG